MFGSSSPTAVVGGVMSCLRCLSLLVCSAVQHILHCVFVLFLFVLCALCCQFLCIGHFLLSLRFSLTFFMSCIIKTNTSSIIHKNLTDIKEGYVSNIVAVSCISGGNLGYPEKTIDLPHPEKTIDLSQCTDILYHIKLYRVYLVMSCR